MPAIDTSQLGNPSATDARAAYTNSLAGLVGSKYSKNIGVRDSSVSPGTAEYYRTDNNQGFGSEKEAIDYANTLGGGSVSSLNDLKTNADAPAATSAANSLYPKFDFDQYAKDRDTYFNSLNMTPEEKSARTAYTDYVANAQNGVNGIAGQGRGIPLALVRGQQEKLQQQAETEEGRLQGNIGIEQTAREANSASANARYGYETNMLSALREQMAPKEIPYGGSLARYNPDTGSYDTVAKGTPRVVSNSRYGNSVYDPASGTYIPAVDASPQVVKNSKYGEQVFDPNTGTFVNAPGNSNSTSAATKNNNTNVKSTTASINAAANNLSASYFTKDKVGSDGNPVIGADGYTSPAAYNDARNAWISDGHPAAKFDSQFKKYVNPDHPQDYSGVGGKKAPKASNSVPVGYVPGAPKYLA